MSGKLGIDPNVELAFAVSTDRYRHHVSFRRRDCVMCGLTERVITEVEGPTRWPAFRLQPPSCSSYLVWPEGVLVDPRDRKYVVHNTP